jgi:hypothetical protein
MKHIKLLDGLKLLDREEWISFRKYILMYCTRASDNYELLDYLYSIRGQFSEFSNLDQIKKAHFSKMSVKAFSNLMSKVFNWYEEWLVWHENNKDDVAQDVQLVKIYNRRGAYSLADKTYRRVEKKLFNEEQLDLEKHKNLYLLHRFHYYSDNPVKYKRKEEILDTLVRYFLFQFTEQALLYVVELHNWGKIQNHDYGKEIELLSLFGSLIDDTEVSKVIVLINKLVKELDVEAFLGLRKVVISQQIKKDSELYILASLYMITFSLRLWNNNKISEPQYVFDAYDFGLESGVLLSTGKIPIVRFMNLVTTLGYIRTTAKTYEFIDKWIHLVDAEDLDGIQALGYAQLKLIEGKYDDLIPLLIGKKIESEWGRLRASSLELIGLYTDRSNNYNIMANRLNNFKRVIRSFGSKGDTFSYKLYINFVKVLELLVKRDFIKLSINLDNYAPIMHKKWLEEEIKAGQK